MNEEEHKFGAYSTSNPLPWATEITEHHIYDCEDCSLAKTIDANGEEIMTHGDEKDPRAFCPSADNQKLISKMSHVYLAYLEKNNLKQFTDFPKDSETVILHHKSLKDANNLKVIYSEKDPYYSNIDNIEDFIGWNIFRDYSKIRDLISCCRKHWEEDAKKNYPENWWSFGTMRFCKICGNKRCPKATNCELECTNSNEPDQEGSDY
jgi:hypothetical protein